MNGGNPFDDKVDNEGNPFADDPVAAPNNTTSQMLASQYFGDKPEAQTFHKQPVTSNNPTYGQIPFAGGPGSPLLPESKPQDPSVQYNSFANQTNLFDSFRQNNAQYGGLQSPQQQPPAYLPQQHPYHQQPQHYPQPQPPTYQPPQAYPQPQGYQQLHQPQQQQFQELGTPFSPHQHAIDPNVVAIQENLKKQIGEQTIRIQQLEAQLKTADSEKQNLGQKISQIEAERTKSIKELQEKSETNLNEAKNELEAKAKEAKEWKQKYETESTRLKEELDKQKEADSNLKAIKEERATLEHKNEELERQIAGLAADLEDAKKDLEVSKTKSEQTYRNIQKILAEAQDKNESLQNQVDEDKQKIKRLNNKLKEYGVTAPFDTEGDDDRGKGKKYNEITETKKGNQGSSSLGYYSRNAGGARGDEYEHMTKAELIAKIKEQEITIRDLTEGATHNNYHY